MIFSRVLDYMEQMDNTDNTFSQLFYKHVYEPLFGYCMNPIFLDKKKTKIQN